MLHPFVSTRPAHAGRLDALPFSIVAHLIVILLVVWPRDRTSSTAGDVRPSGRTTEQVRFIKVAPVPAEPAAEPAAPKATTHAQPARSRTATVPHIVPVSVALASIGDMPSALPSEVDFRGKVTDSLDFSTPVHADTAGGRPGSDAENGDGGSRIYTADLVERIVMPYPNNPTPVYPSSMLSAGIETTFLVQFVVDTTGHVDEKSLRFPSSARRIFADAVQRALQRSRYRPAELGGRRVAQLVEQQFTFRIAR